MRWYFGVLIVLVLLSGCSWLQPVDVPPPDIILPLVIPTYTGVVNMTYLNKYQDNAPANSIEGARGISVDFTRKIAYINGYTDDSLTAINYTNPASLTVYGSVTDSAPNGSIDGNWFSWLDTATNIIYVPAEVDDEFSWYNVSTGTFVFRNDTLVDSAGAGSADGTRSVTIVNTATKKWLIGSSYLDDYLSSHDVTNPTIRPAPVGSITDSTGACSLDGVSYTYNIPGTTYTLDVATLGSYITIHNVSDAGVITCVGSGYTDTSGDGTVQGAISATFDDTTNLTYVASPTGGYLTILNTNYLSGNPTLAGSVGGMDNPVSVSNVYTLNGKKFVFIGSNRTGQGIWQVDVTNSAAPVKVRRFNETSGTGVYNAVYSLFVDTSQSVLYVASAVDYTFYAINLTPAVAFGYNFSFNTGYTNTTVFNSTNTPLGSGTAGAGATLDTTLGAYNMTGAGTTLQLSTASQNAVAKNFNSTAFTIAACAKPAADIGSTESNIVNMFRNSAANSGLNWNLIAANKLYFVYGASATQSYTTTRAFTSGTLNYFIARNNYTHTCLNWTGGAGECFAHFPPLLVVGSTGVHIGQNTAGVETFNGSYYYFQMYNYNISDADMNELIAECAEPASDPAPVISALVNGTHLNSPNAQSINWTTDIAANTSINYGTTTSLGTLFGNATATTSHVSILWGLQPNVTYYYNVTSCSAGGCTTLAGGPYTFTTPACGGIYNNTVLAGNVSSTTADCFELKQPANINCNGFSINGNSSPSLRGIYVNFPSNISNCVIDKMGVGVYVYPGGSGSNITNLTTRNSQDNGLRFYGAENVTVTTYRDDDSYVVLYFADGSSRFNRFINLSFNVNGTTSRISRAIRATGAYNISFNNFTGININVSNSLVYGVYFSYDTMTNNTFDCQGGTIRGANGAAAGFYFPSAKMNTVKNCNVVNFTQGILVFYSIGHIFTSNNVTNNTVGINITDATATGNVLTSNRICNNTVTNVSDDDSNTWTDNTCEPVGSLCANSCTVVATSPDLNLSFGPPATYDFRFKGCGPAITNTSSLPENQTNTYGIDYICNNGTATGQPAIKLSGSPATGWTLKAAASYNPGSWITLTTSNQNIGSSLTAGSCMYVWMNATCTNVNSNPGVYEQYAIS